jgi:hypothetical protein
MLPVGFRISNINGLDYVTRYKVITIHNTIMFLYKIINGVLFSDSEHNSACSFLELEQKTKHIQKFWNEGVILV